MWKRFLLPLIGYRDGVGVCPFCGERSLYLVFSPPVFWCRACGRAGSLSDLLAEGFGLSTEELLFLKRYGEGSGISKHAPRRARLLALLLEARKFYSLSLARSPKALSYLEGRGIRGRDALSLGVGFSPDPKGLVGYLEARGFEEEEMREAGVARRELASGLVDRMAGRITFPICLPNDLVLGFGGRAIDGDGPKYLNTPETDLFSKGDVLFGINLCWEKAVSGKYIVLVEGYFDALSLIGAGFPAAAPLGTALTRKQARILKRYVREVVVAFDPDDAGKKAAVKAVEVLVGEGIGVRIATWPGGRDPDEILKDEGPSAVEKVLSGARHYGEVRVKYMLEKIRKGLPKGKMLSVLADELAGIDSRSVYVSLRKLVAESIGVSEAEIDLEVRKRRGALSAGRENPTVSAEELLWAQLINYPEMIRDFVKITTKRWQERLNAAVLSGNLGGLFADEDRQGRERFAKLVVLSRVNPLPREDVERRVLNVRLSIIRRKLMNSPREDLLDEAREILKSLSSMRR